MDPKVDRCLAALARALPDDRVVLDPDVRRAHGGDESGLGAALPDAVVRAHDAAEVAAVLRACSAEGVPVTPRGAGTGKSGGAIPVAGGIVLACDRMRGLVELDRGDAIAVVEPGLVTASLHEAVEREGLFWGPDPSSSAECTIGGNVACNAAGPRSFKYGATRDWVLGLEVVTGDGQTLRLGRRTRKGSTGYDLTSLVVGSEGTLAVVTRAILRLAPLPERTMAILAFLPGLDAVAPAIEAALRTRTVPRSIEMLDPQTLDLVRHGAAFPIPEAARALLVVEVDGRGDEVERDTLVIAEALSGATPLDPAIARTDAERERFWSVRRQMSRALRASAAHKLSEDVVVPRSRIGALVERCGAIARARGIRMPAYGHAGDGNLHVNLLWDQPAQEPAVQLAIRELFEATVALGGTLSGEHGLGATKAPHLGLEHSAEQIALGRRIKASFDPAGVLNPGKVFPPLGHGPC